MKEALKKYGSVLFLVLFLFPQVKKEIHDFTHKDDFHCMAAAAHFHQQEHSCLFCDFIAGFISGTVLQSARYCLFVPAEYLPACNDVKIFSTAAYFVSLRAPPVVC